MKTKTKSIALAITAFLLASGHSFGQKYDPRLQHNHGDTIAAIFSKNHNYYNFLLFELDYSYEIRPLSEVSGGNIREASDFKNAKGEALTRKAVEPGKFNFREWGIELSKNEPVIIRLNDQEALYFYDKVSNNIRFAKSPLYTK